MHCSLKCIIHAAYWEHAHGVSGAGELAPWDLLKFAEWMGCEVMCKGGHRRMVKKLKLQFETAL